MTALKLKQSPERFQEFSVLSFHVFLSTLKEFTRSSKILKALQA